MRRLACLVVALAGWIGTPVQAADALDEYQIKAAFLHRFAQFVAWSDEAFESADAPIILAVGGHDPFGRTLERTIEGQTVKGRRIEVRRFKRPGELTECHVLFISASETVEPWLRAARVGPDAEPLTVGETPAFWRAGGVISFTIEKKRIRFAINVGAADRAGLRISSKLLSLARLVGERSYAEGW